MTITERAKDWENLIYLNRDGIYRYLKNRPPMLMIEDAYIEPGKQACSARRLNNDEWFFLCHFPGMPMMPGVLQLETIFNTAAMPIKLLDGYSDKTTNIAQISNVKYRRHVLPGDFIEIYTEVRKFKRGIADMHGNISVSGENCCEVDFTLVVLEDIIKQ